MKAFVSHIAEERAVAGALKSELERVLPGVRVFAGDIGLGKEWQAALSAALRDARAILVLCSPRSVERPWVNFESGAGWGQDARVITVCHDGLRREDLPLPLSMFQGVDLEALNACADLVEQTADALGVTPTSPFDPTAMTAALTQTLPVRRPLIGIVLTHGQDKWDRTKSSLFDLPASFPGAVRDRWSFRPIRRQDDLLSSDLHSMSGLILGAPWRARMGPRVVEALVRWVRNGGRLLMLGYELGDRHHGGNLAALAVYFGVQLHTDVVGPVGHKGTKPYGLAVDFDVSEADALELTNGIAGIRLANVQTVQVDPGGVEWLRVGRNVVCRPERRAVDYLEDILCQPGEQSVDVNSDAGWVPIAVKAPAGLCGSGGVHVVGTWEILGKDRAFNDRPDNVRLLSRLLDWLSGA